VGTIDAGARAPLVRPVPLTIPTVFDKLFSLPLHQQADAAQRVLGVAALPPESAALVQLLQNDPAPQVRAAAAARCGDPAALSVALSAEAVPDVRTAIFQSLGRLLPQAPGEVVQGVLACADCPDEVRAEVAMHAQEPEQWQAAIDAIGDEEVLTNLAIAAARAPVRLAAAERVHDPEALSRLAEAVQDKDRGVARIARRRLQALAQRAESAAAADELLAQAEALVTQPGPILTPAVELDRRWKALEVADDERRARWDDVERRMRERFEREHASQRAHAQLEQRVADWAAAFKETPAADALPALRAELEALRAEAAQDDDGAVLERLEEAAGRLAHWEELAPALAAAETLVAEAEELAGGTPIDDAQLPVRWQALALAVRTPALTRRFEAALLQIEQRRLAVVRAAQQQQGEARHRLHALLHEAEQALSAGQLQQARGAIDAVRALKPEAGMLPKPSLQRMSRVQQQLGELERWEQFGQQSARVQLCEQAEALLAQPPAPAVAAREVQRLRAEWKKLDQQFAGVPKPLWQRFDGACEKAYAPAARHFAEQSARHKEARRQREEFIAAAAEHAPGLLVEPRDWRAMEHWLRDTEAGWRDQKLGSVEPAAWKKLDARFKAALAPVREALAENRGEAKTEREALIAQAQSLLDRAQERDAPSQVQALQAQWQAHAKARPLPRRDEQALWERFRAACNAVFDARKGARKEVDARRHAQRHALDALCEQMEQLARSDAEDAQVRAAQRELQEQWRRALAESGHVPPSLEARYRAARSQVDGLLRSRSRAKEAALWRALLARERLCEELDALLLEGEAQGAGASARVPEVAESVRERWTALPPVAAAWENKLAGRRDAAIRVLAGEDERARKDHLARIDKSLAARRDALLELELMLGLPSPEELQPQRLALQVRHLRDRFKRSATDEAGVEQLLLEWAALPGVAPEGDRGRCERIVESIERRSDVRRG